MNAKGVCHKIYETPDFIHRLCLDNNEELLAEKAESLCTLRECLVVDNRWYGSTITIQHKFIMHQMFILRCITNKEITQEQ